MSCFIRRIDSQLDTNARSPLVSATKEAKLFAGCPLRHFPFKLHYPNSSLHQGLCRCIRSNTYTLSIQRPRYRFALIAEGFCPIWLNSYACCSNSSVRSTDLSKHHHRYRHIHRTLDTSQLLRHSSMLRRSRTLPILTGS